MTDSTRYSPPARFPRQVIAMTSEEVADKIQAYAVQRGVSKGEVVRDALDAYFAKEVVS